MDFAEKLEKLTEGKNRSEIARRADLSPSKISDYINKRFLPRLDIAAALAKALGVSLDWLADDSCDWPPPEQNKKLDARLLTDAELMREACLRYYQIASGLHEVLQSIPNVDWTKTIEQLRSFNEVPGSLPADVEEMLGIPNALSQADLALSNYDASTHHNLARLQAALTIDARELTRGQLNKACEDALKRPDFSVVATYAMTWKLAKSGGMHESWINQFNETWKRANKLANEWLKKKSKSAILLRTH